MLLRWYYTDLYYRLPQGVSQHLDSDTTPDQVLQWYHGNQKILRAAPCQHPYFLTAAWQSCTSWTAYASRWAYPIPFTEISCQMYRVVTGFSNLAIVSFVSTWGIFTCNGCSLPRGSVLFPWHQIARFGVQSLLASSGTQKLLVRVVDYNKARKHNSWTFLRPLALVYGVVKPKSWGMRVEKLLDEGAESDNRV